MNTAILQTDSESISTREKFTKLLLRKAHVNGYIEGTVDSLGQNQLATSEDLCFRISPFMKAYKSSLAEQIKIQSDIRAQIDIEKSVISIAAIMEESDYLSNLDSIYQLEQAFEYLLAESLPSQRMYCIDTSVLTFSEQSPLDRNIVTNDYPYVID
jgi:hypothetical protein